MSPKPTPINTMVLLIWAAIVIGAVLVALFH